MLRPSLEGLAAFLNPPPHVDNAAEMAFRRLVKKFRGSLAYRFANVFEAWVFFDKGGVWNLSSEDFLKQCFVILLDAVR
jgi:hypothetical protein